MKNGKNLEFPEGREGGLGVWILMTGGVRGLDSDDRGGSLYAQNPFDFNVYLYHK